MNSKYLPPLIIAAASTWSAQSEAATWFDCDTASEDLCTLEISPNGGASAAIRAPGTQFTFVADGSGFEINGDVELLASGDSASGYAMANADLVVEYADPSQPGEGFRRLRGSADLLLGAEAHADSGFGMLQADAEYSRRVLLGLELGSVLRDEFGMQHLNPERPCEGRAATDEGFRECPYWVFEYEETKGLGLGFGGTDLGVQVDAGAEATNKVVFLMDPADLFIYTGFTAGAMDSVTLNVQSTSKPASDKEPLTNAARGLGFSQHGYIPFNVRTTFGIEDHIDAFGLDFTGHMVLDWHDLPLGPYAALDGSYVVRFPVNEFTSEIEFASHYQLAGNGDVKLAVPMAQGFVNLDMHIGEATAGMKLTEDQQLVFLSGLLNADFPWEPEALPIQLDYRNNYQVAGVLVNEVRADSEIAGLDLTSSFVHIQGEYLFDLNFGRETSGVGWHVGSTGVLKANFDEGFEFHGKVGDGANATAIHPLIQGERDVQLHLIVDPSDRSRQLIELNGGFSVGSDTLSQRGILRVTPNDAYLGFPMEFNPGLVQEAYEDIQAATQDAEAEVNRLNGVISTQRAIVQAEKDQQHKALSDAQADVDAAKAEVNRLNRLISTYRSQISSYKRSISSWYRWYKRQPWHKKAKAYARYLSKKAYYNGLIASRYAAIAGITATREVAQAGLNIAQASLTVAAGAIDVTPVDLDPRVAPLVVSRDVALATLNGLQKLMPEIPSIHGTITWTNGFRIEGGSLTPESRAEYCHEGTCTEIRGGSYEPEAGRACIDLPELGYSNVCIAVPKQA